ncbi:MAG: hypothetical protein R3244_06615 [Thermoanaerobaculia bacterium]|nr:hypothetical protein [Thermoanaerobaculia bacterium]
MHRTVFVSTLTLLALVVAVAPLPAQRSSSCHDAEPDSADIRIPPPGEPGEPLLVTGRVLRGPDREPVAGAKLVAFHTDAEGYYSEDGMDEGQARLCGALLTAEDGSYRIETIRPAHYATGGPPAHIHFVLTLDDGRTRRFTLNFEGDPKLGGAPAGERWDRIRPVTAGEDGRLRVERDLWVR